MTIYANLKQTVLLGPSVAMNGGISAVEALMLQHQPKGVRYLYIPTLRPGKRWFQFLSFLWAIWRLFQMLLLHRSARVVHIHFASNGSFFRKAILAYLALAMRRSVVLHAHGGGFHQFFARLPKPMQRMVCHLFECCTYLLVLSNSWRDFYIQNLNVHEDKVIVLPNPVVLPSTPPCRTAHRTVTFLFLGRMEEAKGTFDLLHAFRQLSQETRRNTRLVLAGDGEVLRVHETVSRLGLKDSVTVHNWLSKAECVEHLRAADVFVLPSYREGVPMALLEAMGWQLPVIVTPVGGIPEVVTPGREGLVVQPGHVNELVNALTSLIQDAELRNQMGVAGRQRVHEFDMEMFNQRLHKIYFTIQQKPVMKR